MTLVWASSLAPLKRKAVAFIIESAVLKNKARPGYQPKQQLEKKNRFKRTRQYRFRAWLSIRREHRERRSARRLGLRAGSYDQRTAGIYLSGMGRDFP